jgi:hypothetical protein
MVRDGTYTGVVDRIVDGATAVLLLEEDGEVVEQVNVDAETLPADARHEGALLECRLSEGTLAELEHRPSRERNRRERLQEKFDRLSKRLGEE